MKEYILTASGSCTTWVTHTFKVSANSTKEAMNNYYNGNYELLKSDFNIDDDYSTLDEEDIKEIK